MTSRTLLLGLTVLASSLPGQTTRNVPGQYSTIQDAIVAALNGDTVLVAPGYYVEPIDFLGKAITVMSSGGRSVTTIQPSAPSYRIDFLNGETTASALQGFTVRLGYGGTVKIIDASPSIVDCTVIGGIGGGGISIAAVNGPASPTITGSTIMQNYSGSDGGGLYAAAYGGACAPVITGCEFSANTAGGGGGGLAFYRDPAWTPAVPFQALVENCVIEGNSASSGGGILTSDLDVLIRRCRIVGNTATVAGGGILGADQAWLDLHVQGCLIAENDASQGGGVFGDAQIYLTHCTLAGNSAQWGSAVGGGDDKYIQSCVIWGNAGIPFGISAFFVYGNDIQGGWFATPGSGNISVDPQFLNPALGDYHLASTSPCIDLGGAPGYSPLDMDGSPRIQGAAADLGADEVPPPSLPGSNEALDLYTWVNGAGDPLGSSKTASAGDLLTVRFTSPLGVFAGEIPILLGRLYPAGGWPGTTPGFPEIRMNVNSAILMYGSLANPFEVPGLPPQGVDLAYAIPPGLSGQTIRLQAFAVSPFAANGVFAASAARDVAFP